MSEGWQKQSDRPLGVEGGGVSVRQEHMGGCQNYGPLLGPLNTRCRIILRTQKGTIILATIHMVCYTSLPRPQRF